MVSQPASGRSGLVFDVCRPPDVPGMCRMLAETFTRNDPPAVAVGLTPAEFEAFARQVAASETTRGLTIVARDPTSGGVAGAMVTEDAALPAEGIADLSPRFAPVFDLFDQLGAQLAEPPVMVPGVALHLFLLGVDDRFAGRGVGQRLVREALSHGMAKGYRRAFVEATNPTSQHVFSRAGFVPRAHVSYAAYRRDGVPVFASIAQYGGTVSMVRDLRSTGGGPPTP